MIDFDAKTVTLGYGDVVVGHTPRGLTFQNIRPPQECGTPVYESDNVEFFGEVVRLPINSLEDCSSFKMLLDNIRDLNEFTYAGWVVKFIPGSDASVQVVRNHFTAVYYYVISLCAC